MTIPAGTPGDEVPEADWAEQATEAGPLAEAAPPIHADAGASGGLEANEADVVEQEQLVELDDEDR